MAMDANWLSSLGTNLLLNIAAELATQLLQYGSSWLQRNMLQQPAERALTSALDIAFLALLKEARKSFPHNRDAHAQTLAASIGHFLRHRNCTQDLLDCAFITAQIDMERLETDFNESGARTLMANIPFDVKRCFGAWHIALSNEIRNKAATNNAIFPQWMVNNIAATARSVLDLDQTAKRIEHKLDRVLTDQALASTHMMGDDLPALPAVYLPRSQDIAVIAKRVRETVSTAVISSKSVAEVAIRRAGGTVAALHGMGGIGKTVLANAYARSTYAHTDFPEGVFWVTIGMAPTSLPSEMRRIANALGHTGEAHDTRSGEVILRNALHHRKCLLVLDDVWDIESVEPFRNAVADTANRLLITTRDGELSTALGASEYRVDVLSATDSQALIAAWVSMRAEDLSAAAIDAIEECGHLPLALSLCGASAADGDQWVDILASLRNADLVEISRRLPNYPYPNVLRALQASVDGLRRQLERDGDSRVDALVRAYFQLGVFSPDSAIPESAIERLWAKTEGLNQPRARGLLSRLERKAMLQTEGFSPNRIVRFHDLQHDFLRAVLKDAEYVHAFLLDVYNPDDRPWAEIEDDRYLYDHLVYHLDAAGYSQAVHELFNDDKWLLARHRQRRFAFDGYISDLMFAWEQYACPDLAKQLMTDMPPPALGRCIHYALIRTSIGSIQERYSPALVARAVQLGDWQPAQALDLAGNVPSPERRARMYIAILGTGRLSDTETLAAGKHALNATLVITNSGERAELLGRVLAYVQGSDASIALQCAVNDIRATSDPKQRIQALSTCLPHFSDDTVADVVDFVLAGMNERDLARLLSVLIPNARPRLLEQCLTATLQIADIRQRASLLGTIAPELDESTLDCTIGLVLSIKSIEDRARLLASLASGFRPPHAQKLLGSALQSAHSIQNLRERVDVLGVLLPYLEGKVREQALYRALVDTIGLNEPEHRVRNLARLIPYLDSKQKRGALRRALVDVLTVSDIRVRVDILRSLVPNAFSQESQDAIKQTLADALSILDHRVRAESLVGLALSIPNNGSLDVLHIALDAVLTLPDIRLQADLLGTLAPHLPPAERTQALELALSTETGWFRAKLLLVLLPYLDGNQSALAAHHALEAALALTHQTDRDDLLSNMAPFLRGSLLKRALSDALTIHDQIEIAELIIVLAPYLQGQRRSLLLSEAVSTTVAIQEPAFQAVLLTSLAPFLDGEALDCALAITSKMENAQRKTKLLAALAPRLSEEQLSQVLGVVLQATNLEERANTLRALATWLPSHLASKALDAALSCSALSHRVALLDAVASGLHADTLTRALDYVLQIRETRLRGRMLGVLLPNMTHQSINRVLDAVLEVEDEDEKAELLRNMLSHLSYDQIQLVFEYCRHRLSLKPRTDLMLVLTPHLRGEPQQSAICQAHAGLCTIGLSRDRINWLREALTYATRESVAHLIESLGAIEDFGIRSTMTLLFLPYLDDENKRTALCQIVDDAVAIADTPSRVESLVSLVPVLSSELRADALRSALSGALSFESVERRAQLLGSLVPYLEGDEKEQALDKAVADVLSMGNKAEQARSLKVLSEHLSKDTCRSVLHQIADSNRILVDKHLVGILAPHLDEETLGYIICTAENTGATALSLELLSMVIPYVRRDLQQTTLMKALKRSDTSLRTPFLAFIAPNVPADVWLLALSQHMLLSAYDERKYVLQTLSDFTTCDNPVMRTTFDAVAWSVEQVVWRWRWQQQ